MTNKVLLLALSLAAASTAFGQNVRLTNDNAAGGYKSVYTLATESHTPTRS